MKTKLLIVSKLAKLVIKYPEFRFLQLISNIVRLITKDVDPFYIDDKMFLKGIEKYDKI
mgnify:CR=1 FL=1